MTRQDLGPFFGVPATIQGWTCPDCQRIYEKPWTHNECECGNRDMSRIDEPDDWIER